MGLCSRLFGVESHIRLAFIVSAAIIAGLIILFTVTLFIRNILRISYFCETPNEEIQSVAIQSFILTIVCIMSMILVIIHNICRLILDKHLLIDTLINAVVYRIDLLINLISILYSTPSFKKHY